MDVGIRKDLRIDVKLLKYELHNALQRKGKKNWCRYWNAFQQYIVAELSLDELNEIIHSTLSKEDVALHNAFVTALIHNANTQKLPKESIIAYDSPPKRLKLTAPEEKKETQSVDKDTKTDRSDLSALIQHIPGSPVRTKRKVELGRHSIDGNKQAIRRMLELTRSKGMRTKCKVSENKSAALNALLMKYASKRLATNRTHSKRKYALDRDHSKDVDPTQVFRPHRGRLATDPSRVIETGAVELVYPIFQNEQLEHVKPEASDYLPNGIRVMEVVEQVGHDYSVRGVTKEAANMLTRALQEHIRDILAASAEALCNDNMMPPVAYSSSIRNSAKSPSSSSRMAMRSLHPNGQAAISSRLQYNNGPSGIPFAWPIICHKKSTKSKVKSSNSSKSTSKSSLSKSKSKSDTKSNPTPGQPLTVQLEHLLEGVTSYPNLVGGDAVTCQERILARMFNKY